MKKSRNSWGFDTKDMDKRVKPQDDFFHYASGNWIKRNPIPKAESRWGSFTMLRHETDKQLQTLMKNVVRRGGKHGSAAQMIGDFYKSGMDEKRRAKLGLAPLFKWISKIENLKSTKELVKLTAELNRIGVGGIWGAAIDQDMKDSERYIIYLYQSGLGMPDRDYYLKDDAESRRVRAAYIKYLERVALLANASKAEAKRYAKNDMEIETALAKASMRKEDTRDVDKTYHKMSVAKLAKLTPTIDWRNYLKTLGAKGVKEVVVMQPDFLKAAERLLASRSLEDWKVYLMYNLLIGYGSYLSPAFERESFAFYGTVLTGTKHMKPLWRRILRVTNGHLGELFGQLYVKKYFGAGAKKKVEMVVADLFTAYEHRIKNLDWMSPATKKKAIQKLHEMTRKLGYPDKWKSYRGLVIKSDDYAGNAMRSALVEHNRVMKRLNKKVDRKEWFMTPQTVNAYCSFGLNDVVFPAAILQHPFFDASADDAINYGAMGSVIGHEITHGFDDQGSKFDGHGNRKTWWTSADRKRFEKKSKVVVEQFNKYEVADGVKVNGQLTLGENIADLGGLSIAFDAYQLRLKKTGKKTIAGLSPEQRFFLGYAATERENERPEFAKTHALTDPHSPSLFRVNGPLSNLPEFYEAFGLSKKSKLYRKPQERAKIW